jgi:hypothetical protein
MQVRVPTVLLKENRGKPRCCGDQNQRDRPNKGAIRERFGCRTGALSGVDVVLVGLGPDTDHAGCPEPSDFIG